MVHYKNDDNNDDAVLRRFVHCSPDLLPRCAK